MASFTDKLGRAWRHWRSSLGDASHAFSSDTLAAVGQAITEGERGHRGEVRLIVEKALPLDAIWDEVSNRQRALALFAEHGVWDTEDNCGVLVYVNLADRKVDIVADRAINRRIEAATWQRVCDTMTAAFRQGDYRTGTLAAIGQINALLREHFPADGRADANELPDHPIVL